MSLYLDDVEVVRGAVAELIDPVHADEIILDGVMVNRPIIGNPSIVIPAIAGRMVRWRIIGVQDKASMGVYYFNLAGPGFSEDYYVQTHNHVGTAIRLAGAFKAATTGNITLTMTPPSGVNHCYLMGWLQ